MSDLARLPISVCAAALLAFPATPMMAQTSGSTEASEAQLGEIVVTANRREESLNKVPASIAAYDRAVLDQQGIRNFSDIVSQTPGLSLQQQSTFQPANIAIRGVRSVVGAATTGVYIDDTPIQTRSAGAQSPGDALPAIFDIERVEVLRGPQGTLFGSGSEGGAVRFISPTPDLDDVSGYGRAEVATTESGGVSYEGGIAAGVPLVEGKLAVRMSASYRHDAGFVDRINERTGVRVDKDINSVNTHTMKLAALWSPTESLRITPSLNFQETRGNDYGQFYVRLSDRSNNSLISGRTNQQPSKDRFYLPALKIEADFGNVTATSVTSLFVRRQQMVLDFTLLDESVVRNFNGLRPPATQLPGIGTLPVPILIPEAFVAAGGATNTTNNKQRNFTQELRLQSNDTTSQLSWLIGGFYQKAKQGNIINVRDAYYADAFETLRGLQNREEITRYYRNFSAVDEQLAAFGNVDLRLGALTLSAGGRVASTKFSFDELLEGSFVPPTGRATNAGRQKETPFTPKVSASLEPNDRTLLYASASKGYRVGGANVPITATPPCLTSLATLGLTSAPTTFDSDSVWNYEVGGKVSVLNRKVQINASAYHIDWSNIQSFVSLSGCPGGFITNLGSANSDGFDIAISARPVDALFLSVSGGYNKSRFAETLTSNAVILAQKGAEISDAPPWQITATVEYSLPLADGDGYIRGINQYNSRNNGTITRYDTPGSSGYDPNGQRNSGYHLTSLRAGWRNEAFDASLFVDNVFNSHPQLNYVSNAFPTDTTYYANTLRPRTIGLTITARR